MMLRWVPRSSSVFLSLLLHTFVILWLSSSMLMQPDEAQPAVLPVSILSPPPEEMTGAVQEAAPVEAAEQPEQPEQPPPEIPIPERQIVSPPDAGLNQLPPETRFLSDRDVTVEEEMVKRGEPEPGSEEMDQEEPDKLANEASELPPTDADTASEQAEQLAALPRLEQLLPSALQLAEEGYGQASESSEAAEATEAEEEPGPLSSGTAWLPATDQPGTLDFLPDVREGDITLLNTKAELNAPFVRRVAVRVFQHLVILLRHEIKLSVASTKESVTAEAIMNRQGDMVSVMVSDQSTKGVLSTHRKLRQACSTGFFDRNPPPSAEAEDGNIHFVLRAFVVTNNRGRYGTGYRVVFQAGLL